MTFKNKSISKTKITKLNRSAHLHAVIFLQKNIRRWVDQDHEVKTECPVIRSDFFCRKILRMGFLLGLKSKDKEQTLPLLKKVQTPKTFANA